MPNAAPVLSGQMSLATPPAPASAGHRGPTNPTRAFWPLEAPQGVSPDRPRSRIRAGWEPRGGKLPLRHGSGSLLHPEGRRRGPRAHGIPRALSFHDPGRSKASTLVQALAIPRVCGKVQSVPVEPSEGAPTEPEMGQRPGAPLLIDVLIGIDYYYEFVTGRIRRTTSGTVAVEARLGCLVCGRTDPRHSSKAQVLLTEGGAPPEDTDEDGTAEMKKLEEELRLDDGRYSVSLPWVPGGPDLPNNYSQARRRLLALGRRLGAHEDVRVRYASVMKQYLDEGWAESAPATSSRGGRGVGDERKCRVVFDGAAKYNGTTLNSQLEAGPNLQIDLLRAILSFRRRCVGLQADIEKMYLQIRVRPEDRDVCRFLWWDDEQMIRSYRLTRVCFGLTCSPFLAMGTVRLHVRRHQASAPRAAEEVLNNMYKDDLATSCDSVAEARSLADQLGSLLASGGFWLHKWASNEPDALRELPVEKTAMGVGGRPWKTLTIYWQRDDDNLTFVAPEGTRLAAGDTKRQMLSTAAGIFDSIGCLAPFLVLAKILFQSLWETGADWDEPLPEEVNRPWIDWKRELDDLPLVLGVCALGPSEANRAPRLLRRVRTGIRGGGLLAGGNRVRSHSGQFSGREDPSLPRKTSEPPEIGAYGSPDCGEADPFRPKDVAARRTLPVLLERQRGHTSVGTVSGQSVEAIRPQSRQRDPTASGTGVLETLPGEEQPGRLTEPRIVFEGTGKQQPLGPSEHNSLLPIEEARAPPQAALLVSVVTHAQDDVLHPGRYGDIERLFRITALCLRFVRNCGSATGERRSGPLTVQELDAAEQTWVRIAQRQGFRKEIELRTSGDVSARSHLRPLSPFLDEAGTLRVRGRLEKSNLPLTEKHPAILPNEHEIIRGLILRCHAPAARRGVPDPSHATTALLGPAGAQSREAYYPRLFSMPLGHGSAYPAENGRAAGGPDDPGACVCSRGHGFRRPTICEDD
ncbi:hypothetical protein T03_5539 [Trichinella britovi]|uniref:Peptidase aspartic putative domain-containing protein n=1 Tax=Trichinella britovi TaxID=45882 RepID=A0A0V1D6U2_TRIBR|nr:hypothetical protein T03_5539 [Trichinella britovi]